MSAHFNVRIEDVAARAVEMLGTDAYQQFQPGAPLVDWRISFTTRSGAHVTMPRGATADDVAAYFEREDRAGGAS